MLKKIKIEPQSKHKIMLKNVLWVYVKHQCNILENSFCCYLPPPHEVCLNYEVVVFQPWTLTTTDLGSVAYCYVAYLLDPTYPILLPSNVLPLQSSPSILVPHGIIRPLDHTPSPYQNTQKPLPHCHYYLVLGSLM